MILQNIWIFYLFIFFVSFILAVILTPIFKKIAVVLNIYDRPDEIHKIHNIPIPYLGGVAVIISVTISFLLALHFQKRFYIEYFDKINGIFIGALIILVFGLYDDIKKMEPILKLLGQILVATILYFHGLRIEFITNPFGGRLIFGILDRYIISVLWIVFFMNAMNLIDGIDGLATGVALISAIAFVAISIFKNSVFSVIMSVSLAGALAGFLIYNFPPAKIFLGDVGSMFIGYFIAVISLSGTSAKISTILALIVPVIILFIPVYDTILAAIRRLMAAKYVFIPDRSHLHHKLLDMGFSGTSIILAVYMITLFFAIIGVLLVMLPKRFYAPVAFIIVIFIIFLAIIFRAVSKRALSHTDESNDNSKTPD